MNKEKKEECEHKWQPLGIVAGGLYKQQEMRQGGYVWVRYGDEIIAAIYCEKCGEIKKKFD